MVTANNKMKLAEVVSKAEKKKGTSLLTYPKREDELKISQQNAGKFPLQKTV